MTSPHHVIVPQVLMDLIPGYIDNRKKDLANIRARLFENNFEALHKIAHQIKGHAGAYGFHYLGQLGAQLDHAAKEADGPRAKGIAASMEFHLSHLKVEEDPEN